MGNDNKWEMIRRNLHSFLERPDWNVNKLASLAGIKPHTLARFLGGDTNRMQPLTVTKLQEVTKYHLDTWAPINKKRQNNSKYKSVLGDYLAYRRSYDYRDRYICSFINISWDEESGQSIWSERQKNTSNSGKTYDYYHYGKVAIHPSIGILQLIQAEIFTRITTLNMAAISTYGELSGYVVTTVPYARIGVIPVCSPILLIKHSGDPEVRIGSHKLNSNSDINVGERLSEIEQSSFKN